MKNTFSSRAGFTVLEIIIVVTIIGVMAAIAVPGFVHNHEHSQQRGCINNLRLIDSAIQQYAFESNLGAGRPVTVEGITPYLIRHPSGSVNEVFCPADAARTFETSYNVTDTSTSPTCEILGSTHLVR